MLFIEAQPLRSLLADNRHAGLQVMTEVAQVYFQRYLRVLDALQGIVSQVQQL